MMHQWHLVLSYNHSKTLMMNHSLEANLLFMRFLMYQNLQHSGKQQLYHNGKQECKKSMIHFELKGLGFQFHFLKIWQFWVVNGFIRQRKTHMVVFQDIKQGWWLSVSLKNILLITWVLFNPVVRHTIVMIILALVAINHQNLR